MGKKKTGPENNSTVKEEVINPIVVMGNISFHIADFLDEEKRPQIELAIEEWVDKKKKAMEKKEKRKAKHPIRRRR